MSSIIAVDFGTTKLEIAVFRNDVVEVLEINDSPIIPNAVFFGKSIQYGRSAITSGKREPEYLLTNLKQLLAKRFDDPDIEDIKSGMNMQLVRDPNGYCEVVINREGLGTLSPVEILSGFLKYILNYVEDKYNLNFKTMVLGIPPSFNDIQKEMLKSAIRNAGIENPILFEETCAVCCSFGMSIVDNPTNVIVVDCGGGTIDASLVNVSKSNIVVKSIFGNPKLGGTNFTAVVFDHLVKKLIMLGAFNDVSSLRPRDRYMLHDIAEEIKIALSSEITVDKEVFLDDIEYNLQFTRTEFENICNQLFKDCEDVVRQLLQDKSPDITPDALYYSGYSFLMPALKERIRNVCGMEPKEATAPGDAVVYGLLIYGNYVMRGKGKPADEPGSEKTPVEEESLLVGTAISNAGSVLPVSTIVPPDPDAHPIPIVLEDLVNTDMYDLSIYFMRTPNTDRRVIYYRNKPRGTVQQVKGLVTKEKEETSLVIYQGNLPFVKDMVPIKKLTLLNDARHPQDKAHKYYLKSFVLADGTISIQLFWADTNEQIEVIEAPICSEADREKIRKINERSFNSRFIRDIDGTDLTHTTPVHGIAENPTPDPNPTRSSSQRLNLPFGLPDPEKETPADETVRIENDYGHGEEMTLPVYPSDENSPMPPSPLPPPPPLIPLLPSEPVANRGHEQGEEEEETAPPPPLPPVVQVYVEHMKHLEGEEGEWPPSPPVPPQIPTMGEQSEGEEEDLPPPLPPVLPMMPIENSDKKLDAACVFSVCLHQTPIKEQT